MKMPISEIADRLSIAMLKKARANAENQIEIDTLSAEVNQYLGAVEYVEKLLDINGLHS